MQFRPFFERPKGFLLRIAILHLLRDQSMHGYEIMKRVEEKTQGHWCPSHSMLYKMLENLESAELITSKSEMKGEIERTVYTITKQGKTHVNDALKQLAQSIYNLIQTRQGPPLLIPNMIMEHLSPEEQKELLVKLREELNKHLQEVEKRLSKL
jgi:DNA-binding PadR family transcriptional regulator